MQRYLSGVGTTDAAPHVGVCTNEKAGLIIQSMATEGRLSELVCVVYDEFHGVGADGRGATLEASLAKLLLHARRRHRERRQSFGVGGVGGDAAAAGWLGGGGGRVAAGGGAAPLPPRQPPLERQLELGGDGADGGGAAQIVAMSATLPNAEHVARWLAPCEVHQCDWRPVGLTERIVVAPVGEVLDGRGQPTGEHLRLGADDVARKMAAVNAAANAANANGKKQLSQRQQQERAAAFADAAVCALCMALREQAKSALIFCATKQGCEAAAKRLAEQGAAGAAAPGAREALMEELRLANENSDPVTNQSLQRCCRNGVAFYHADLSDGEKRAIEAGMASGALRLIVATTTLAEGVNLPVRRVIVRDLHLGQRTTKLTVTRYRQMAGRAGRQGLETAGEVFVLAPTHDDADLARRLLNEPLQPVVSQLDLDDGSLSMLLLEAAAAGLVQSEEEAHLLLSSTLSWADRVAKGEDVTAITREAIGKLAQRDQPLLALLPPSRHHQHRTAAASAASAPLAPGRMPPKPSAPLDAPLLSAPPTSRGAPTLAVTRHGRAASHANGLLRLGVVGADALNASLHAALGRGVHLMTDVQLLYLFVTDEVYKEARSSGALPERLGGALCQPRVARPARCPRPHCHRRCSCYRGRRTASAPAAAPPPTHLARVVALVEPLIDSCFCCSIEHMPQTSAGVLRAKLGRLWLALILSTLIGEDDPRPLLQRRFNVSYRQARIDKLLSDVASRATGIARYLEELEGGGSGGGSGGGAGPVAADDPCEGLLGGRWWRWRWRRWRRRALARWWRFVVGDPPPRAPAERAAVVGRAPRASAAPHAKAALDDGAHRDRPPRERLPLPRCRRLVDAGGARQGAAPRRPQREGAEARAAKGREGAARRGAAAGRADGGGAARGD